MTAVNAWRCPKCGRSVPRTVEVCRCGHQRTGSEEAVTLGAPAAVSRAPASEPASGPAGRPPTLVLMGLALVAGIILTYMFLRPAAPAAPTHVSHLAHLAHLAHLRT